MNNNKTREDFDRIKFKNREKTNNRKYQNSMGLLTQTVLLTDLIKRIIGSNISKIKKKTI
jgi:hypothetical protein